MEKEELFTVPSPVRLAKYGQPDSSFERGYPLIDGIILYEQKMEIIIGKVAADQITAFSYQIAGKKPIFWSLSYMD